MDRQSPRWRKSTHCQADACEEIAQVDGEVWLRDSKLAATSSVLKFSLSEWVAFRDGVMAGEF